MTLADPIDRHRYAYFLTAGLASVLALTSAGQSVEVATIGTDTLVWPNIATGTGLAAATVVMFFAGGALRMPADTFHRETENDVTIRSAVEQCREAFLDSVVQAVVCHSFHSLIGRLSTWLLRAGDRLGSNALPLTHGGLARVLGTPRTTVTDAALQLQATGAIWYRRGNIVISNRSRLAEASCPCASNKRAGPHERPNSDSVGSSTQS
jgi:CRP-like cAMP-binding protein